MPKDIGIATPGVFESVGKNGEAFGVEFARRRTPLPYPSGVDGPDRRACGAKITRRPGAIVVGGLGHGQHGRSEPGVVDEDGAETKGAEDAANQTHVVFRISSPVVMVMRRPFVLIP